MKKQGDMLLMAEGFVLSKTIDTPVKKVMPDAKQYVYKKVEGDDYIIFDTQQNSIKFSGDWNPPTTY